MRFKVDNCMLWLVAALFTVAVMPSWAGAADLKTVLSKYDLTLYGRVKVDLNYDTAEFPRYNDFLGAVRAGADNENDSVNFNPRDSRLGFSAVDDSDEWTSEARIETDFYGENAGNNLLPRMRLGYVKASHKESGASLLVGQDWIPVAALNPPTIDFGVLTAAGNLWWRVPQVTFRQKIDDAEVLLSLMKHRRTDTADEARMPWLLGRLAYNFEGGYIAAGGGWRTEDMVSAAGTEESVDRWLAALELKVSAGQVGFMLEPWIGQGVDNEFLRYELGINNLGEEPVEIAAWGGFAALTFDASDALTFALGYGIDDPDDDDLAGIELNDRQFEFNQQAFVNGWYSLTEAVKVGLECVYVSTTRYDEDSDGVRITASTLMAF